MKTTEPTIPDLELALHRLGEQRSEIAQEMQRVHDVLNAKLTSEAAKRRVESLSDPERAALLQELQARPITSEGAFGEV